nr:uncharacterized protein LOC106691465 [Halyomorpha halys]
MVLPLREIALRAATLESVAGVPVTCLHNLPGDIIDELLIKITQKGGSWSHEWEIFLTPKIRRLLVPWDVKLFRKIGEKCRSLEMIYVTSHDVKFTATPLRHLPQGLHTVDLSGEVFYAGDELPKPQGNLPWLMEVDYWLRRIEIQVQRPVHSKLQGLCRLHLGRASASSLELIEVLKQFPNLILLRHYQMVTALCQLHMEQWKEDSSSLPRYKLTNIDADFSHVVRCRMSPKAVLPPEALRLSAILCPEATSIRLRFDTSTPHHVVGHLTLLKTITDISAVCVTSGERTLLDFQDFVPLLDQFGSTTLRALEFKVVEEVDPHVILRSCKRLEQLTLSGCGFAQNCSGPPRCRPGPSLNLLKVLFFADGDDFSWDHTLPQCFWLSILAGSKHRNSRLHGLFLESPRMTEDTLSAVLGQEASFPQLQTVCTRRAPELGIARLAELVRAAPTLSYLRTDGIGSGPAAGLKRRNRKLIVKLD